MHLTFRARAVLTSFPIAPPFLTVSHLSRLAQFLRSFAHFYLVFTSVLTGRHIGPATV